MFPLTWLKNRKREHILAEPFPAEWPGYLRKNIVHYQHLGEAEPPVRGRRFDRLLHAATDYTPK